MSGSSSREHGQYPLDEGAKRCLLNVDGPLAAHHPVIVVGNSFATTEARDCDAAQK